MRLLKDAIAVKFLVLLINGMIFFRVKAQKLIVNLAGGVERCDRTFKAR
ncbi:hypothetical protein H6G74_04690 [Nostoc spongiaeforme FACHB-130]|uniref:Uncharacterized protein n=1 Tax=Nostoc spongiaeforme FACHB-130 TaxID=1357510 RepID=A0ABR8FQC6_9NOSO|nr:hypothetical protein [Nostoc spongiaeforme]MBD2593626.1 hypothetical protein [Nostoc spongiaeforme FACHB-130]